MLTFKATPPAVSWRTDSERDSPIPSPEPAVATLVSLVEQDTIAIQSPIRTPSPSLFDNHRCSTSRSPDIVPRDPDQDYGGFGKLRPNNHLRSSSPAIAIKSCISVVSLPSWASVDAILLRNLPWIRFHGSIFNLGMTMVPVRESYVD